MACVRAVDGGGGGGGDKSQKSILEIYTDWANHYLGRSLSDICSASIFILLLSIHFHSSVHHPFSFFGSASIFISSVQHPFLFFCSASIFILPFVIHFHSSIQHSFSFFCSHFLPFSCSAFIDIILFILHPPSVSIEILLFRTTSHFLCFASISGQFFRFNCNPSHQHPLPHSFQHPCLSFIQHSLLPLCLHIFGNCLATV